MKQRYIRCIALLYSCIFTLTWRQSLISRYSDTARCSDKAIYSDTAIQRYSDTYVSPPLSRNWSVKYFSDEQSTMNKYKRKAAECSIGTVNVLCSHTPQTALSADYVRHLAAASRAASYRAPSVVQVFSKVHVLPIKHVPYCTVRPMRVLFCTRRRPTPVTRSRRVRGGQRLWPPGWPPSLLKLALSHLPPQAQPRS